MPKWNQEVWQELKTPAVKIRYSRFSDQLVSRIMTFVDHVINDEQRAVHDNYLAGIVGNEGEQISLLDKSSGVPLYNEQTLSDVIKICLSSAAAYVSSWVDDADETYGGIAPKLKSLTLTDLWLNVYAAGDYNPLHTHMSEFDTGLSFFLYLNVPDEMSTSARPQDGRTEIVWGRSTHNFPLRNFEYPGSHILEPVAGGFYIFPSWVTHQVYPYRNETKGKRISLAGNVGIEWQPGRRGTQLIKFY